MFLLPDGIARVISIITQRSERRKRLAVSNLYYVLGREPTPDELKKLFFFHALYHIQLALFPLLYKLKTAEVLVGEGFDDLLGDIMERGAVAFSGHIGLPECASIPFTERGAEVYVLVEKLSSAVERTFFNGTRRMFGLKIHTGFKELISEVKNPKGKLFVFLVDRPLPGSKPGKLFGALNIQDLPLRISRKFGIPLWGFSALRHENWKVEVKVKRIKSFDEFVEFTEKLIRKSPLEWNPFFGE